MFGKNDGVSGIYGKDIFRQRVTFNPTFSRLAEGGEHYDADGTYQIQRCFHRTNSSNTWTRSTALTIHAREARTSLSTDLFIRPLETSNYERPIPQEGTISVATGKLSQIIGTDTEFTRIFTSDYIIANASKDGSEQRLRIRSDTEMLLWWNYRGDATHADDSAGDITDATFTKERVTVDVRPNRQYNLNNGKVVVDFILKKMEQLILYTRYSFSNIISSR